MSSYIIDVQNLNKSFKAKPAVRNLSLQVPQGEIFGFLGPNGSGKTTTIRMLCGLLTPDSGTGHCLGYDIIRESARIKLQVGYMTQKFSFYEDLTIEENLLFIARIYSMPNAAAKVAEIIARMGFKERRKQLTGTLSGGWKQRVALAACLLHEPRLLLLDEPTAGVDPKARRIFWDEIHQLREQGITTLVSTHYMDEALRCTRLAYIAYGDLLVQGTSAEVIAKVGLTTWQVTGQKLPHLAKVLQSQQGVEQVVMFGEELHVSGTNAVDLLKAIAPWQAEYSWKLSATELEDAFIYLVGQTKEP
jgi:ABC-2 type transport system ATP-binding protein